MTKQPLPTFVILLLALLGANKAFGQAANPDFAAPPNCSGFDVLFVIDESGSMGAIDNGLTRTQHLRNGIRDFLTGISDRNNRAAIASYGIGGWMEVGWTDVTAANVAAAGTFGSYLASTGDGAQNRGAVTNSSTCNAGSTNPEAGFRAGLHYVDGDAATNYFGIDASQIGAGCAGQGFNPPVGLPAPGAADYPELVIYMTDGTPNFSLANGAPGSSDDLIQIPRCTTQNCANAPINEVDQFKANGSHVFSFILDSSGANTVANLVRPEITGPGDTQWDGLTNDISNIAAADYFISTNGLGMAQAMANLAQSCNNSLPVTLESFVSKPSGSKLKFKWSTASETFNFGFNLWGEVDGEWYRLNKAVVPARSVDSLTTSRYRKRVSTSELPGEVTRVGVSSVEINGHEEFYGPYAVGESAGAETVAEPIDWNAVAAEASAHLVALGYVQRGRNFVKERKASRVSAASADANRSLDGNSVLAEFRSSITGMHRVTHGELLASNVDLSGLAVNELALTVNGNALPRFIHSSGNAWDAASYVDYYEAGVSDETLLHTNESVVRLAYDPSRVSVLAAGVIDRDVQTPGAHHQAVAARNEQLTYDFAMPKPDPWYERYLYLTPANEGSNGTQHTFTLPADNVLASAADAVVDARVIALTDFGPGMDHRVELVHVNGSGAETVIDTKQSDGYATLQLSGSISAAALDDSSTFRIKQKMVDADPQNGQLPAHWLGSAAYFDSASVTYAAVNETQDDLMHWQADTLSGDGFLISGFQTNSIAAYAHAGGSLMRLEAKNATQDAGNRWAVEIPAVAQGDADYWMSTESALQKPAIANPDINTAALATGDSDYLIISHPTFINRLNNPDTQTDEQDFIANKESHGHRVSVVDYEQVAQVYGYGHRTPEAITAYLKAETQANANLQYVLLVGNASRDANDYTGNGSWNLIPTYYDSTHAILNYAPNDGRLADTNGDGYQDLAIGRWPARTEAELNTLINKTIAYTDGGANTPATQTLNKAVLAADVSDGNNFGLQMDSVNAQLMQAGFATTKVYKDSGRTSQDLINAINVGQSITSYSGHAGPSQWSYNGLLHYSQVDQLTNEDHPTLMLPLSCYTTYTVSEHTDTLGQKLMTSNAGAVAIMGAASLSSYDENQSVITDIMTSMTTGVDSDADGNPDITLSLGEAVTKAKRTTAADSPVNISGNLIGDPSIRIGAQHSTSGMATRALKAF